MTFPSRPAIIDIAREAGVSPIIVSTLLSGSKERADAIGGDTVSRIRAAMATLGYVERDAPASRPRRRTNRVLLLVCRTGSLYSQMLAAHSERELSGHGITLSVQEGDSATEIRRAARLLEDGQVDGLLVETDDELAPALGDIDRSGGPLVAIGPTGPAASHDVVTADDSNAIREAMLHLIDQRYENFVLMSRRDDSNRDYRTTIARDQLRALGVPPDRIATAYSAHDPVAAFEAISSLLPRLELPVAIVTGSDSSAIGVLWACHHAGIEVPRGVGVLGYGNSPESAIAFPPLSTIGPEHRELRTAAALIASRIEQPSLPGRHVTEPWGFLPRESTHAPGIVPFDGGGIASDD